MHAFLAECRKASLSDRQLRLIESVVAEDEGWIHRFQDEDWAAAEAAYRRSAALGGDSCMACLIDVVLRQHPGSEGIEAMTRELSRFPGDPLLLAARGTLYFRQGKGAEALPDLRRAAELGNSDAQNNLGELYMMGVPGAVTRDTETGIAWFRKAAAQDHRGAQRNLEIALITTGQPPK